MRLSPQTEGPTLTPRQRLVLVGLFGFIGVVCAMLLVAEGNWTFAVLAVAGLGFAGVHLAGWLRTRS